ncbi:ABC transporter substrate-binding protein [Paenibacillus senegalensis]|uniref:ABC transporter substrate-binding protein n=1 Tax=Paenibacillus senegalensis TaxID=1465766 RepID=UPI00028A2F56|nr:ABC transporter substrate-binding protein [Paenibacillus senegalensis]
MKSKALLRGKMIPLFITAMLALSACGGQAPAQPSNQGGSEPAPAQSPAAPPQESKKPSGKVVVYTAGPAGLADKILEGFQAETGLTVEQFQGTTGKVLARLEAEKSNPVADIVVLASWPSGMSMKQEGWTQAYPEAVHADRLYDGWVDEDHHLFGYSASALGITYNTKLVDDAPADWSDLADAKWSGVVNIPDPSLSGSALDFVSGYLNQYGESGWSLFEMLRQNEVTMAGANQEALDPVVTGAKSVVMAGVDYMAYSARAKGEPVDIVYPASGTVINPRPAMILKDAPNLDNAKLFIDYLLSDEAQSLVADAYLLPGRSDMLAKEDRTQVQEIKLLQYDWNWMSENGDDIITQFLSVFKQ